MVRVKICGITRLADARAAVDAGADALGFVFAQSPRRVSETKVRWITSRLAPWITKVGVFVNARPSTIARTMKRCGLDAVQLHGEEPPADARALRKMGFPVIKALRVRDSLDKQTLDGYPADAFLLDTAAPGIYGGSGRSFDWRLLRGLRTTRPLIISGGLRPGNVRKLLKNIKPYGVDVSSGVENSPRKKDTKLVRKFVKNAKTP